MHQPRPPAPHHNRVHQSAVTMYVHQARLLGQPRQALMQNQFHRAQTRQVTPSIATQVNLSANATVAKTTNGTKNNANGTSPKENMAMGQMQQPSHQMVP
ncbi:hypothetical protein DYY67_2317 [Candidatus Nitrosotalea sp. TS]|nr:hypothetical protein [Candidatus Nitrosotalea sp. TS]